MNQTIQSVVIVDENNAIGKNNELLAKMPEDLKHFKALTTGFPVIMGRKTFESVGCRPLPNRRNIVVTRQDIEFEGAEIAHSIEEALGMCKNEHKVSIVGGATIYEQSMHLINTIELTRIHNTFDADAFFPEVNPADWKEVENDSRKADEKNPHDYTFSTYVRR